METSNASLLSSSISVCFSNRSSSRSSISPSQNLCGNNFSNISIKKVSRRSISPSTKLLTLKSENLIRDVQNSLKNIKDKSFFDMDINSEINGEVLPNIIKNVQFENNLYFDDKLYYNKKSKNQNDKKDSDDKNWF